MMVSSWPEFVSHMQFSDMRPFHRRAMSQVRNRNPSPPAWTDDKLLNEESKSLTLSLSGLTESWRRVIITVVDTKTDGQRSLCLQRSSTVTAWLTGRSRYQLTTCYCGALRGFHPARVKSSFSRNGNSTAVVWTWCRIQNVPASDKNLKESHISTIFTMLHRLRVDPGSAPCEITEAIIPENLWFGCRRRLKVSWFSNPMIRFDFWFEGHDLISDLRVLSALTLWHC